MISTVLFDVDGVLVVGEPFSVTLAREYGITLEMTAAFFRDGPFQQCLVGKADLKAEIASHLPQWGWRGSVEEFVSVWFTTGQQVDAALLAAVQQLRALLPSHEPGALSHRSPADPDGPGRAV